MKRAPNLDILHVPVKNLVLGHGWSVIDTAPLGDGYPDLACFRGLWGFVVEVKTPGSRRPSRQHDEHGRNPAQVAFAASFLGNYFLIPTMDAAWQMLDQVCPPHCAVQGHNPKRVPWVRS